MILAKKSPSQSVPASSHQVPQDNRNEKEDGGSASADDNLQMKEYLLGLKGLPGPTVQNQPSSCSSPHHLLMTILMVIMMTRMMVMNITLALLLTMMMLTISPGACHHDSDSNYDWHNDDKGDHDDGTDNDTEDLTHT